MGKFEHELLALPLDEFIRLMLTWQEVAKRRAKQPRLF